MTTHPNKNGLEAPATLNVTSYQASQDHSISNSEAIPVLQFVVVVVVFLVWEGLCVFSLGSYRFSPEIQAEIC